MIDHSDFHRRVAFLPFTLVTLKSLIPREYEVEPNTIGDHIRKRRLQLGLYQKDVASMLKIDPNTLLNWEKGYTAPFIENYPAIYDFLGDMPCIIEDESIPALLLESRRRKGWTQEKAAKALGVDPCTWSNWERDGIIHRLTHRRLVAQILSISEDELSKFMKKRWNEKHVGQPFPHDR